MTAEHYQSNHIDHLKLDLAGSELAELRKLLDRGLNTWERAPDWLLKLAEIVR